MRQFKNVVADFIRPYRDEWAVLFPVVTAFSSAEREKLNRIFGIPIASRLNCAQEFHCLVNCALSEAQPLRGVLPSQSEKRRPFSSSTRYVAAVWADSAGE